MHLHFHLVPRYKNDGLDLTDQHYQAEKTELEQVQKTITSQLSGS
jgi:diadenosine tetraphosphate (Ap4A) HIT family hydrolase